MLATWASEAHFSHAQAMAKPHAVIAGRATFKAVKKPVAEIR
jgi:dihydrofolate reductase